MLAPLALAGAAHALIEVAGTLVLMAVRIAAIGMTPPVMNAHSQSIWRSQVPPEMQGRVFSVQHLIAQFTAPLATAGAGLLGAQTSPGVILLWTGVVTPLVCTLQRLNPALRRVDSLPVTAAPVGAAGQTERFEKARRYPWETGAPSSEAQLWRSSQPASQGSLTCTLSRSPPQ